MMTPQEKNHLVDHAIRRVEFIESIIYGDATDEELKKFRRTYKQIHDETYQWGRRAGNDLAGQVTEMKGFLRHSNRMVEYSFLHLITYLLDNERQPTRKPGDPAGFITIKFGEMRPRQIDDPNWDTFELHWLKQIRQISGATMRLMTVEQRNANPRLSALVNLETAYDVNNSGSSASSLDPNLPSPARSARTIDTKVGRPAGERLKQHYHSVETKSTRLVSKTPAKPMIPTAGRGQGAGSALPGRGSALARVAVGSTSSSSQGHIAPVHHTPFAPAPNRLDTGQISNGSEAGTRATGEQGHVNLPGGARTANVPSGARVGMRADLQGPPTRLMRSANRVEPEPTMTNIVLTEAQKRRNWNTSTRVEKELAMKAQREEVSTSRNRAEGPSKAQRQEVSTNRNRAEEPSKAQMRIPKVRDTTRSEGNADIIRTREFPEPEARRGRSAEPLSAKRNSRGNENTLGEGGGEEQARLAVMPGTSSAARPLHDNDAKRTPQLVRKVFDSSAGGITGRLPTAGPSQPAEPALRSAQSVPQCITPKLGPAESALRSAQSVPQYLPPTSGPAESAPRLAQSVPQSTTPTPGPAELALRSGKPGPQPTGLMPAHREALCQVTRDTPPGLENSLEDFSALRPRGFKPAHQKALCRVTRDTPPGLENSLEDFSALRPKGFVPKERIAKRSNSQVPGSDPQVPEVISRYQEVSGDSDDTETVDR